MIILNRLICRHIETVWQVDHAEVQGAVVPYHLTCKRCGKVLKTKEVLYDDYMSDIITREVE